MKSEKKVLIVNRANTGYGGISSVMMNYVRKTHNVVNYDFVLCCDVEQSIADELRSYGANVYLPPFSRSKNPFSYSKWLENIVKERRYDAIHVHGTSGAMYSEIHAAKKAGIPVRIAHSHSTSCKYMIAHRILKPLLNRELTHALACSDMAGKWLFTHEYKVLPNCIDVDKFAFSQSVRDEYRKSLGVEDKLVIGHVGYMDTEKNHMFLLRVFERLVNERPDARLLLIGDGRLRTEIESFTKEHHLEEYVQLLGKRGDVAQLYQCMDVFVLPSIFEGLPVTLVEAQAAGLCCIVSDNVTKQVDITKNIHHVSIHEEKDIDLWKKFIIEVGNLEMNRQDSSMILKKSEFNIHNCIDVLLQCYNWS